MIYASITAAFSQQHTASTGLYTWLVEQHLTAVRPTEPQGKSSSDYSYVILAISSSPQLLDISARSVFAYTNSYYLARDFLTKITSNMLSTNRVSSYSMHIGGVSLVATRLSISHHL